MSNAEHSSRRCASAQGRRVMARRALTQREREFALCSELASWEPHDDLWYEKPVVDAFTLMDRLVAGATPKGQYYADYCLIRIAWWETAEQRDRIFGWMEDLRQWGEISIERIARNCYGGSLHPVYTIQDMRRFRRWQARPAIPRAVREEVYDRDGYACLQCGSGDALSIDHVVPWSKGGEHTIANFQTLCMPCNMRKGARLDVVQSR